MEEYLQEVNALEQLRKIIDWGMIRTLYQPIVSLKDGKILGYEALSRGPVGSQLESPVQLFNLAMKHGMVWELELLCRRMALERSKNSLNGFKLFLNVDPHIINDEKFRKGFTLDYLKQYNIDPASIIFEITEKTAIDDFKVFRKVLLNYIDQGYKIAIDDTGSGYSGLKMLAEICPQYIKIDMDLIRNIDKDYLKRTLLETFHQFALLTNMSIIAEGIEREDELKTLVDIGIEYGQGFYIQRPAQGFFDISPEAKRVIIEKNEARKKLYFSSPATLPVGEIARLEIPFSPQATGEEVDNVFRNNPAIYGIPVVDDENKPVGLIMRNKFYTNLASQYGYALYNSRPIYLIKDSRPLILDYYTPLDQASRISVTRKEDDLYDYVIITRKGKYFGIITIKDLLINSTQLELNIAKHSNPLTGLPGNLIIEEKLKKVIDRKSYSVIYVDLDNFKAYNDVYGFENGDQIILATAAILSHRLAAFGGEGSFLGHIGGDDFLIITSEEQTELICKMIIDDFQKKRIGFYSLRDRKRGYILAKDRQGNIAKFPLITLSLAVVIGKEDTFDNIFQLTEKVTEVKERCKEKGESCYCIFKG